MKMAIEFCYGCNFSIADNEESNTDVFGHVYHRNCYRTYLKTRSLFKEAQKGIVRCEKCNRQIDLVKGRPEGVIENQISKGVSTYICKSCAEVCE